MACSRRLKRQETLQAGTGRSFSTSSSPLRVEPIIADPVSTRFGKRGALIHTYTGAVYADQNLLRTATGASRPAAG